MLTQLLYLAIDESPEAAPLLPSVNFELRDLIELLVRQGGATPKLELAVIGVADTVRVVQPLSEIGASRPVTLSTHVAQPSTDFYSKTSSNASPKTSLN